MENKLKSTVHTGDADVFHSQKYVINKNMKCEMFYLDKDNTIFEFIVYKNNRFIEIKIEQFNSLKKVEQSHNVVKTIEILKKTKHCKCEHGFTNSIHICESYTICYIIVYTQYILIYIRNYNTH